MVPAGGAPPHHYCSPLRGTQLAVCGGRRGAQQVLGPLHRAHPCGPHQAQIFRWGRVSLEQGGLPRVEHFVTELINVAAGAVWLPRAILHGRPGCLVSSEPLPSLHVVLSLSEPFQDQKERGTTRARWDVCFQFLAQNSLPEAPPPPQGQQHCSAALLPLLAPSRTFAIPAYCATVMQLRPCARPAFSAVWVCRAMLPGSLQVLLSEQANILLGPLAVQSVLGLAQPASAICFLPSMCRRAAARHMHLACSCARASALLQPCLLAPSLFASWLGAPATLPVRLRVPQG